MEMKFFEALAKVLYAARLEKKMTQSDLSINTGINRTYISDIERGKRNPSLSILLKLAEGLALPLSAIILRTEYILKEGRLT